ncbi:hypothetical protein [Fibrella arboris]|uniref:hypothetical protein n=1 Tax=Fibrella arboris TaxID=3242486 RepID=UPI0035225932
MFCPAITDLSPGTWHTDQNALSNGDSPVDRDVKQQKNSHYQLVILSHETRNIHLRLKNHPTPVRADGEQVSHLNASGLHLYTLTSVGLSPPHTGVSPVAEKRPTRSATNPGLSVAANSNPLQLLYH